MLNRKNLLRILAILFVLFLSEEFYLHLSLFSGENIQASQQNPVNMEKTLSKPLSKKELDAHLIESMQNYVQNDYLCKALENIPEADYARLLQIFTNLHLLSSDWSELADDSSPFSGKLTTEPKSEAARFFTALLLSNQLDGINVSRLNFARAKRILINLTAEFPDNGAYPFFLLPIEEKLNNPDSDRIALARDAARSTIFDTHFASFARAIQEASWYNATSSFLSQIILSTLPIPATPSANLSFMKVAKTYHLTQEIHAMALLLMKQGLESKESNIRWGYLPVEYSLGRALLAKGDPAVDPNSFPKYSELPVEKMYLRDRGETRESPILEMQGCADESKFRDWFSDAKSNQ